MFTPMTRIRVQKYLHTVAVSLSLRAGCSPRSVRQHFVHGLGSSTLLAAVVVFRSSCTADWAFHALCSSLDPSNSRATK
jgi:hypothetical protein